MIFVVEAVVIDETPNYCRRQERRMCGPLEDVDVALKLVDRLRRTCEDARVRSPCGSSV
jgi:hypothetical protein